MSEVEDLYPIVMNLFRQRLDVQVETTETDLFETGTIDSLMFVELTLQLEDVFGITIPIDKVEFENFRSVATIADFVLAQSLAQHGKPPRVC